MSTKKTLLILGTTCLVIIAIVIYNLILNNNRSYKMISIPKYGACFLVASDYEIEKTQFGFKYKMLNNYGEFKLLNLPPNANFTKAKVGDFNTRYSKLKNDRIVQYILDDQTVLEDTFVIIKKMQPNLVPLRTKCPKLLKRYPLLMEIQ